MIFNKFAYDSSKNYILNVLKREPRITMGNVYDALHVAIAPELKRHEWLKALSEVVKDIPELIVTKGPTGGIKYKSPLNRVEASIQSEVFEETEAAPDTTPPPLAAIGPEGANEEVLTREKSPATAKSVAITDTGEAIEIDDTEKINAAAKALIASYPRPLPIKVQPKSEPKYQFRLRDKTFELSLPISKIRDLMNHVIEAKEDDNGFIECSGVKYSCDEVGEKYLDKFLFYFLNAAEVQLCELNKENV